MFRYLCLICCTRYVGGKIKLLFVLCSDLILCADLFLQVIALELQGTV